MSANWVNDGELVESLAGRLFSAMSMFPKRLIHVDELIRVSGMPLSHMQILSLAEEGDLSIGQLSDRMGVAKPNITPLVDTLCERGYVSRLRKDEDRRMVYVHLEEAGAKCLRELRALIARQIQTWPDALKKSDMLRLGSALDALLHVMESVNRAED